ncbi:MAG TPA: tetratricopeptide repeat protein [Longimicrobiaceae bacterium]|jgi:tetratricopeptide (TPR) repeat protein|nr:tetratricopeptide repeat protein [Longimicrobiaceae bacterium]
MQFRSFRLALPVATLALASLAAPLHGQDAVARAQRIYMTRQYAAARRALEPYARSHPNDARAAFWMGRTYLSQKNADSALVWLQKAVELDARPSDYHLHLGNALGLKGLQSNMLRQAILARQAKAEFERAVEIAPRNVDAHLGLMRFYLLAPGILGGDMDKALAEAGAVKRVDAYVGALAAASVQKARGDVAALTAEYEAALRRFPDSTALYIGLGNTYDGQKRFTDEVALYERFIRRRPDVMVPYYQLGRIAAVTGQGLDRGAAALQRYLQSKPVGSDPSLAAAHWRLGMVYARQARRDQARAEYRAALAIVPNFPEARASLAQVGG